MTLNMLIHDVLVGMNNMELTSKIYIAGHRGLVGSAIVTELTSLGYNNLIVRTHTELDLTNQLLVEQFFREEKPEYVFLAAAKVGGIYANNKYRAEFIYQNLQIQNNIIHSSYLNKVKKLLFLGSSCIYPKESQQPIKEEYLLTNELEYTNEPYAIAKITGIKMCESYNLQYGTNYIAAMPTNLYGVNDNFDLKNSHVVPAMIRKSYLAKLLKEQNYTAIAKNLNINTNDTSLIINELANIGICHNTNDVTLKLWGSGTPYREFLHVTDMARACVFLMNKVNFSDLVKNKIEVRNTHINIGTGEDISIKELAYLIANLIGFDGIIQFDSTKPDGTMKKLQDVTKIHSLGWKHSINLEQGLKNVIESYTRRL